MFCSASSWPAAEILVGLAQLLLLGAELLGLGLGLLEQVLGERVGLDRVEDEADALGELIEERLMGRAERENEASSITARTDPSNRIGSTMMFSGGPRRARVDPHVVAGTSVSRIRFFSLAHCPTRPSPTRKDVERCLRSS
jgi:hypothetical protein